MEMEMLKIWGRANSINVQKVLWAADELGLKFERVDAGGAFGVTDTPQYLAMNPNKVVPTIQDGDATIWESNSIVRYLGATYGAGKLWPSDPKVRALADRWMDWQLSTISEPMRIVFWGLVRTPPEKRDMAAIEAAAKQAGELFRRLDGWLAGKRYVAGAEFSMGDIPVGCFAYRWYALPIERPELANMRGWYERLRERAPYMKHIALPMT
jgi:glutathione S-transferase